MSNSSYVDGIKVKISEKYKPPYRISLPFTYSQRLNQNKQILDSQSNYDFSFEETCLQKIEELQHIKITKVEERRNRLEEARKEFEERFEKEEKEREEARVKKLEESSKNLESTEPTNSEPTYPNTSNNPNLDPNYTLQTSIATSNQNYYSSSGILMPTPAPMYSNILTPIPMSTTNYESNKPNSSNNRKLFNLSDFEADTSSPFDNMELKSINDLEELAQVLKSDRSHTQMNQYTNHYMPSNQYNMSNFSTNHIPVSTSHFMPTSTTQLATSPSNLNHIPVHDSYSQYNYVSNSLNYVPASVSTYSHANGYYFNAPPPSQSSNYREYSTVQPMIQNSYITQSTVQSQPSLYKSSSSLNSKSVPDIMQSLEDELTQVNLRTEPSYVMKAVPTPSRPKSIDTVYRKVKKKEDLVDPLEGLSEEEKNACRSISSMGFPLDRVVRVRKIVGDDYKKVVDHLLALSDLLDLGFPEKDASGALLDSDNDRDKALDSLIT